MPKYFKKCELCLSFHKTGFSISLRKNRFNDKV